MDLLIKQYDENGNKVLDNLTRTHQSQRSKIMRKLAGKKKEMAAIYTEAKGYIQGEARQLKEDPIRDFEKQWLKQQDAIKRRVQEGRKVSE